MNDYTIDLEATREFHRELAEALPAQRRLYRASLEAANNAMREQRIVVTKNKQVEVALSAVLLSEESNRRVGAFTERLHGVVEQVLDTVVETPGLMAEVFTDHARLFSLLAGTRGCATRQVVSRYDLALEPAGRLRVMELNTSCPGGYMVAEAVSIVTLRGLERLGAGLQIEERHIGCVLQEDVVDAILAVEDAAGIEEGAIGVLTDENELTFELDLLAAAFRRRLRDVYLGDARKLEYRDGRLYGDGRYLSAVYNKFRISTPHSQNHCWREGFEHRYDALLQAQRDQNVVFINNLYGMAIAEDKSLLALFHHPAIRAALSEDDLAFVDEHTPWTARFVPGLADYRGEQIDLIEYVRQRREQFVVKPANEGRGFGVVVGRFATEQQWAEACQFDPACPCIVQEFVHTQELPVICQREGRVTAESMFLTLGAAVVRGRFQGIISRISANPVTNVAREGFLQAVFVGDELRSEKPGPMRRTRVAPTRPSLSRQAIRLDNTLRLQKRLAAMLPSHSGMLQVALTRANQFLARAARRAQEETSPGEPPEQGISAQSAALSALVLSRGDVRYLKRSAETLHESVERLLDHVLADTQLRDRWFSSYAELFPYFAKTRGGNHWQSISRYDAVVTAAGGLRFIDLNAGAPAALLIGEAIAQETRRGFQQLSRAGGLQALNIGSSGPFDLVDALLAIEARSGLPPQGVAVVHHAGLAPEAEILATALEARGRNAVLCGAGDLVQENGQLTALGQPVSLAYSHSRMIDAAHGDTVRLVAGCRPFLEAQRTGQVVAVNNLAAHTLASDKSLLAMFFAPESVGYLAPAEAAFVAEHVAWTAILAEGPAQRQGERFDLLPYVRARRGELVLKPARAHSPSSVIVGPRCDQAGWEEAIERVLRSPVRHVVQEYATPFSLPIICERDNDAVSEEGRLTLGLTVLDGRYNGVISNVYAARDGGLFGQAVFVVGQAN
ncbi:circularly permuted type 2 ATP-grasp protein [Lignipirellula cremea]|uniref:Glutathionylspermidine synthase n=1 Tax=Lignipirellula cremea TaxID=2528010 RepID=A0A518E3R6_9BACT|nr:circularly permuted type 2 ATP-grasp protein [Lignipirellula cremea]QDU98729.1 Glutathionylspermidine synthase [Lignipirellula cremea]